ncbi:Long chain acyl-CoA synthetase 2 [Glycine soja]
MLQPYGINIGLKEHSNPVTPKAYTPKSPSGPLPPDSGQPELFIHIIPDKTNNTLSIIDNGIGMTKAAKIKYLIWVYGNSFESFLVAVVVPERKAIEDWAKEHNLTDDFKSLCDNLKARKHILDELNNTGQKHQLRGFELLKSIHLEPNPFDIERDLITPTFKLKRPQLLKYYKDHIDQLYKEAKGAMV